MDVQEKKAFFIKNFVRGKKVYNFGSSEGKFHIYLKNLLPKIFSVDKFGKPDIKQDFNKKFIFKEDSIDTIVASEVIEHLESPINFLRQCKKVIAKEGRIIITTPNAYSLEELKYYNKYGYKGIVPHGSYPGHINNWNKQNFDTLINEAGLKVKFFSFVNFFWSHNYPFIFLSKVFKVFSPQLFYVLEK